MKRRIRSIGTRLVVTTAVVIVLLLGILAVVMMNVHRQDLMQHVRVHANQLIAPSSTGRPVARLRP